MSSGDVETQTSSIPGNGQLATVTSTYQVPPVSPGFVPRGSRPHLTPAPTPEPLVISVVKKRWWLLLLCALAAGVGAFALSEKFGTKVVKVEGSLIYKEIPGTGTFKVFTPPTVETFGMLMKQPAFLEQVIGKLGIDIPPLYLERCLDVEGSSKVKSISATLQWNEDDAQAVKILDTILDSFIEEAARWRTEMLGDNVQHIERMLLASGARVDDAAKRLREFQQKSGLGDQVLSQMPATVITAQSALEAAELTQSGLEVQLKTIAELKKTETLELNEKRLELKRNRLKSAQALYANGHKQWKRIQEILLELDGIAAKVSETEPLEWKKQLDKIGKDVLVEADTASAAELASLETKLAQADQLKAEIELGLVTKSQEITMLKERVEQKQGKLKELNDEMRPRTAQEKELLEEVENANHERKELMVQRAALKGIEMSRVREFKKIKSASIPLEGGIAYNNRKIFLGAFFALSLVLAAPVFGCEYFARRESPADETARKFGLPVLSRGALDDEINKRGRRRKDEEDAADDPLRLLALRIQQSLHRPGSVIVFSALDHEESPISLICKLAICFAERDEAVLVLDASGTLAAHRQALSVLFQNTPHRTADGHVLDPTIIEAPGSTASAMQTFGIADFLLQEYLELTDLSLPTRNEGVDCIHGGARPFPREGLATRRMTELLEQCRSRYSMILIAGPSAQQHTDLQLLAARADGLLFTVAGDRPELRQGHEVLQDLLELDAPIIGLIG